MGTVIEFPRRKVADPAPAMVATDTLRRLFLSKPEAGDRMAYARRCLRQAIPSSTASQTDRRATLLVRVWAIMDEAVPLSPGNWAR